MSVSFTLLKANGQRFDLLPGHDDREVNLSKANAADVLDALGIEGSFSERPWPIRCFRALLIVARRKRLGQASLPIPVTETQESGKMLVIDCGRVEGYIEQRIGATHVGWANPQILRPTTGMLRMSGVPPSGPHSTRGFPPLTKPVAGLRPLG
jgi:hypothetical protein